MQKNVVTKTFSTRRSSTGVVKRNVKNKIIIVVSICLWIQLQFTGVMKKNVGHANYRVSFKCNFNKLYSWDNKYVIYFWKLQRLSKTNQKKNVRLLEPLKYNFNEQWVWNNKYVIYFWKLRRLFKTNQKIDHCTPKTFLFCHRKYSGQSVFKGCMNLPNFLLSSYGGVAVSISIFLKLKKNYNEQK